MMHKVSGIFFLLILTVVPLLSAETRVYQNTSSGIDLIAQSETVQEGDTFRIRGVTKIDGKEFRNEIVIRGDGETQEWRYKNITDNVSIVAYRNGDRIIATSVKEGQQERKELVLDGRPWYQDFGAALEEFVRKGEDRIIFKSVGSEGPGWMSLGEFEAYRKGVESVEFGGMKTRLVHLEVKMTGFLSLFWTGNYYYRVSDGKYVMYRGAMGPDSGEAVIELVKEE